MNLIYAFLAVTLLANPAFARSYGGARPANPNATQCIPSSDPNVPPCGVKDEAPIYFPDKLDPSKDDSTKTKDTSPTTAGNSTNAQTH